MTDSTSRLVMMMAMSLAMSTASAVADEAKLPMRKAGQWELRTIMDEGNGPRPEHTLQICVDEAMEKGTAEASDREHKANCTSYRVTSEAGTTVMEADCVFGRQVVQSRTEMRGDFQKDLAIKISSTTIQGGGDNKSTPVKRTISQTGRYVSEKCQDGLAPGEAIDAKGNKMQVQ